MLFPRFNLGGSALLVPPTVSLTFGVKLSVGIPPAMGRQIPELAHTVESVVGWTIHSGNTGVELLATAAWAILL